MNQLITVNIDCDATLIPSGEKITLVKGTHVRITQALGGDFSSNLQILTTPPS